MKANVSLDMELVHHWAAKYDKFKETKPEAISKFVETHSNQPLQFYCDLFLFAVLQYHKTNHMSNQKELGRYVAHGALVSYAAHEIEEVLKI